MKLFTTYREEAVDGTESNGMGVETQTTEASWYYTAPQDDAQGIAGNGDMPEWLKADKYKSVEDQAKAYSELEKKFGGFIGSPKDDYVMPEELAEAPLDEGMVNILKEIGKENNMSQNMFNDLLSRVVDYQAQTGEQAIEQARQQLGADADSRINNVQNWLNTNAPQDIVDKIAPMATSAEAIEAIEWFMSKAKSSKMADTTTVQPSKMTDSEYGEMLMAKDKFGNLKMSTDPQYKKQMDELTMQRIGGN